MAMIVRVGERYRPRRDLHNVEELRARNDLYNMEYQACCEWSRRHGAPPQGDAVSDAQPGLPPMPGSAVPSWPSEVHSAGQLGAGQQTANQQIIQDALSLPRHEQRLLRQGFPVGSNPLSIPPHRLRCFSMCRGDNCQCASLPGGALLRCRLLRCSKSLEMRHPHLCLLQTDPPQHFHQCQDCWQKDFETSPPDWQELLNLQRL